MILVTGATGFVGRVLIPRLVESGAEVRCLLRPQREDPRLPRDVPIQVVVADMADARGMRAALVGVKTVIHLASMEHRIRNQKQLIEMELAGSRNLMQAAQEVGVQHVVYLSHLGADRASAFPACQVKGLVEDVIRRSKIPYSILRSGLLFGAGDHFTNPLAALVRISPFLFLMPGDGHIKLHPVWVEDITTCIEWCLDDKGLRNLVMDVGGPEFLSLNQIIAFLQEKLGTNRKTISVALPYLRALTRQIAKTYPRSPLHALWFDQFAVNRACEIQSIPRYFGIRPTSLQHQLGHLTGMGWWRAWKYLRTGEGL